MKCLGNTAKGKLRLDRGIAGLDLGDNSSISVLYIPLVPQIPKMIPSICNEAILMTPLPSVQNSSTAGSSLAAVYHRRPPLLMRERWFQKTAEKGTVTTGLILQSSLGLYPLHLWDTVSLPWQLNSQGRWTMGPGFHLGE